MRKPWGTEVRSCAQGHGAAPEAAPGNLVLPCMSWVSVGWHGALPLGGSQEPKSLCAALNEQSPLARESTTGNNLLLTQVSKKPVTVQHHVRSIHFSSTVHQTLFLKTRKENRHKGIWERKHTLWGPGRAPFPSHPPQAKWLINHSKTCM